MIGLLLCAVAGAAPGVTLSTEQLAELRAGEVVVVGQGETTVVAVVDVAAPPREVLDAVMDLAPRVGEVGTLKSMQQYLDEPGREAVRWELGIGPARVAFHTMYQCDYTALRCTYGLDASKDNDLSAGSGAYEVEPLPEGGARLYVTLHGSADRGVPAWARKLLVSGSTKELVGGIKSRAERS